VHDFVPEPYDFVLYMQLATLQLANLEIIDRRMRERFADFSFERPVPFLQFRKMRLHGHVWGSPSSDRHLTVAFCHKQGLSSILDRLCGAANPPMRKSNRHSA
jgi:hypothetical protein